MRMRLALVAACLVAAGAPADAVAARPCWHRLVNDWYDGRVDGWYPAGCYRDVLEHLPDTGEDGAVWELRRLALREVARAEARRATAPRRDDGGLPVAAADLDDRGVRSQRGLLALGAVLLLAATAALAMSARRRTRRR
jgi:hypothetical protein